MATIPDWFVEELLARTDIVELIGHRVTLKRAGTNYSACCPFHNEKTPSFVVFARNQNYHCFGCGAHGDAITFVRNTDNLGYIEALEYLAGQAGLPMPQQSESERHHISVKDGLIKAMQAANQFYQKTWKNREFAAIASDYLKKRGLQGQTAKHYQMGLAPVERDSLYQALRTDFSLDVLLNAGLVVKEESGSIKDRFRARVLFPIRDKRGHVLGFGGRTLKKEGQPKYLNSPETPLFHKGHELYGLYEAMLQPIPTSGFIIVEGYMDVVMLCQHGIGNAVASLGTACTREQIRKLFKLTPHITFCFDGDKAGKKAAERALSNVLPELEDGFSIHFLLLPEEHDPDSYVREHGKEAFLEKLALATPLSDFLFGLAARDLTLQAPDDKVIFIQNAQKLIELIKPGLFQSLLLQELAKRAEVANHLIKPNQTSEAPAHPARLPSRQKQNEPASLSLVDRVVMMVLKDISLAKRLPDGLLGYFQPYEDFIKSLKQSTETEDSLSLIHAWANPKEQALLLSLHRRPITVDNAGMRLEFDDAVRRFEQMQQKGYTEALLKKASVNLLSEAEKQALSQLLRQKRVNDE